MKATTLRFVLTPLAVAAIALVAREALKPTPAPVVPGEGTAVFPAALAALLAQRLPRGVELEVLADRSRAELSSDDSTAVAETFAVGGRASFDASGGLAALALDLRAPGAAADRPGHTLAGLRTSECRARETPVAALRAASADAVFVRSGRETPVPLEVRWSALPDGSVAVQGEGALAESGFDLPERGWTAILRNPPRVTFAFDLVLARRG